MTTELTEQERKDLEDSLSDDTNLLSGQGCTDGIGYAPTIARYCTRADLKAINAYFDACDKAWQEYMNPLIEKCMDRQYAADTGGVGEDSYVELDASPKGGQDDTNMKPAPTTTGTQAQIQVQRTAPLGTQEQNDLAPPPTPKQLLMLTVRYHVPQNVIDKLNKWTAMRLIAELTERSNV